MPGILPTIVRAVPLSDGQDRDFLLASWILTTAEAKGVPIYLPDYTNKVWTIGNASGNTFGGTGVCSLKGSNAQPVISTAVGAKTHTYGTASGATTNSAGYAKGATVITLAAAGTGSLLAGDLFVLGGDTTNVYRTTVGLADVSLGGAITIAAPGLAVALPASPVVVLTNANRGIPAYFTGGSSFFIDAVGTGSLLVGDRITFAGDPTVYTIRVGDLDVSVGMTAIFPHPPLQAALATAGVVITLVPSDAAVVLNKASSGTAATASAAGVITTVESALWVYPELTTPGTAATVTVRLLARRPKLLRR